METVGTTLFARSVSTQAFLRMVEARSYARENKKHICADRIFFVLRMVSLAARSYTRENIRNMSAQLLKLANGRGVLVHSRKHRDYRENMFLHS